MFLPLFLATAAGAFAQAPPGGGEMLGVIVRLEPTGQAISENPQVTLQPATGDAITLSLTDDGRPPDVAASDGRFAGIALTSALGFDVTMTLAGQTLDGGSVEWGKESGARDLVLTLQDGALTATASSPEMNVPPQATDPTQGGTAPAEVAGSPAGMTSAATIPPAASGGMPAPAPVNSTASDDGWLWLALGAGALGLMGGLMLMLRGGSGRAVSDQLERAPTPPVFGPGTPSLSSGLHIWTLPSVEHGRFLQHLVGTIAQNHRVLLVLPPEAAAPAVHGGPVFITRASSLDEIDAVLADLEARPGPPLAMIILEPSPDADRVAEYAEMMDPDPGAILLCAEAPAEHKASIRVELHESTATLHTWDGPVRLLEQGYRYIREQG